MVNENIKKILQISAASHLVAINAMLITKSSGERLLGFGVVSSELRVFSRKLEDTMSALGSIVFQLVKSAADLQKQNRERRQLLRTMAQHRQAQELLDSTLAQKEGGIDASIDLFEQNRLRFERQINRTMQLCKTGNALTRCAKIEAAYGGETTAVLMQVSDQIEGTVQQILATLKVIKTTIEV